MIQVKRNFSVWLTSVMPSVPYGMDWDEVPVEVHQFLGTLNLGDYEQRVLSDSLLEFEL